MSVMCIVTAQNALGPGTTKCNRIIISNEFRPVMGFEILFWDFVYKNNNDREKNLFLKSLLSQKYPVFKTY